MLRRLLHWYSGRLRCRFIDHDGQPYLERYLMGTVLGTRVYLHRFVASDPDGLHDHPFRYALSLILAGRYLEHRWGSQRMRRWANWLGPDDFHRVELLDERDVWTIFIHTARVRPWGFIRSLGAEGSGSDLVYSPESKPDDPAFSDWSQDRTGRDLRRTIRHIPAGLNARAYARSEV